MPFQALAAAATLLTVAPHGNRIELQLDRGSAEVVWVSPSAFRFRRVLNGKLPDAGTPEREAGSSISVQVVDGADDIRLRTRTIEVIVTKKGVRVEVRRVDGQRLVRDVSEAESGAAGVTWERETVPGADFYGLGPRTDASFSLLGKSLRAEVPFFISTAGYGEYHAGAGSYHFDFSQAGKYKVTGAEIDYYT
jgi:hypothetical protein